MTELEKATMRMALEFCELCWRDVALNSYALEKLEQTTAALTQALATTERAASICDGFAAPDMAAALRGKPKPDVPETNFRNTTERKLVATPDHNGAHVPASPSDMQVYNQIAAGYWTERKREPGLFATEVQPQPLRYSLDDYHRAPSEGPLNATWQDKPHRLLYDLVAALAYYTSPQATERKGEPPELVPREWRQALRKLAFMARTSGGTSGPDAGLQAALQEAEEMLAKPYSHTPPQVPEDVIAILDECRTALVECDRDCDYELIDRAYAALDAARK